MIKWDNKIIKYGTIDPEDLLPNERNFRIHPQPQQKQMLAALDDVGWVQDVIVNLRTSEEWSPGLRNVPTLVDGHLRVKLALRHDIKEIPVKYVDLTPRQEAIVLATFDAITENAEIDPAMLNALLEDVNTGEAALQELLAQMADEAGIVSGDESTVDADPQIDKAEELRVKWGVETGQLWGLGKIAKCPKCGKIHNLD